MIWIIGTPVESGRIGERYRECSTPEAIKRMGMRKTWRRINRPVAVAIRSSGEHSRTMVGLVTFCSM